MKKTIAILLTAVSLVCIGLMAAAPTVTTSPAANRA